MNKDDSIARLRRQVQATAQLASEGEGTPAFLKWKRDTAVVIEKTFGTDTKHLRDFEAIRYGLMAFTSATPRSAHHDRYVEGLRQASAILESLIDELQEFGVERPQESTASSLDEIRRICERFHLIVRQLRARHAERPTLDVEDEYDVQDLLHALLHISFDDIRREEWTPSYAGGSSRMDFLLKREQVVVETKRTRKGLEARRLGDELLIDIQRYQSHQDCKSLVCFVFDPEGRIVNPRGIEQDLSGSRSNIEVLVIIAPK